MRVRLSSALAGPSVVRCYHSHATTRCDYFAARLSIVVTPDPRDLCELSVQHYQLLYNNFLYAETAARWYLRVWRELSVGWIGFSTHHEATPTGYAYMLRSAVPIQFLWQVSVSIFREDD